MIFAEFLGHTVTDTGIIVGRESVRVNAERPAPTDAKDVSLTNEMIRYPNKFFPKYAELRRPVSRLNQIRNTHLRRAAVIL